MEAELQFTSVPLLPSLPIVDPGQQFRRREGMAPPNGGESRWYFYQRLPPFKVEPESSVLRLQLFPAKVTFLKGQDRKDEAPHPPWSDCSGGVHV